MVSLLADTPGDRDSDGSALCLFCESESERDHRTSFFFFWVVGEEGGTVCSAAQRKKKIINLLPKLALISYSGRISL